ncbi:heat shock protein 110, putative [Plasmodium relictum]|uniref:Heat shock protein 110, putative n=1 Tax=Plasmodium relictum TaxID=85471 RepID=A0A1J1H4Q5_PLARL|nr:heat shock protein 110, putative [Plasmodium relictum]CRG98419.1 heat shock protein 110, putative [Plasmodium relictum]
MSVLGIDIGNENSVVATINKGAINIVRNDLSERLTPTLVGFTEKERLIGDSALSKLKSNYNNTCRNIKNLIGKIGKNIEEDVEMHEAYGNLVPCEYNYLGYEVEYKNEKVVFSAVRVLSALLSHLIKMAEKYMGKECKEIVLSYPPTFTNCQKECLVAATKIINVNALRIISDNTAVALDYGMYRMKEFKEDTGSLLAFVNIGYANTCVCIARFFSNKCEILCDIADANLGGRNLDNELIKYITNLFVNTYKMNPLYKNKTSELCEMGTGRLDKYIISNNERNEINNKARIKLQEAAIKTKKVLSANNESSIHVECLYEDLDCQGSINRETFEQLCYNFFLSKLQTLLDKAIAISKVNIQDIQSIEILGGSTRIPFIQNYLQQYFHKPLSKTLIADESIARGCVLSAAMISKHYKVKEYEVIERITHPINVEWHNINDASKSKVEKLYTRDSLKKKVKKIVIPEKGQIKLTAYYENTPDLPSNCIKELGSCIVKINEKNDKICESHVMTTFSNYDTFTFLGAQTVSKTVVKAKEEKKKTEEKAEESQKNENENKNEEENEKNIETNKEKEKDTNKTELKKGEEGKIQTCYTTIPIETLLAQGSYSSQDIFNFSEAEISMQHSDILEGERLKHRNELETIIYETRNRINGMYKDFVTEEERNSILLAIDDFENWLYDNIEENKNMFIKKKEEIRDIIKDTVYRYDVYTSKQQNLGNIINHLKNIISQCGARPSEESQNIITKTTKFLGTINSLQEQEKNKKLYEPPVYTLNDIEGEFNEVTQLAQKYFSKIEAEELAKQKEKEKKEKEREKEREKEKNMAKEQEKQKNEENNVNENQEQNNKDMKNNDEMDSSTKNDNPCSTEETDI